MIEPIEKELQRQIMKFEEEVKNGSFFNDKTKFATYANNWLENNQPPLLAPKTYERYRAMLDRINESLGEHQLTKLQSHHIQEFYNSLRKEGAKKVGAYATSESLRDVYLAECTEKSEDCLFIDFV